MNVPTSQRILQSTGAAILSQLVRVAVTFATHMVLRRLILIDDWGLWHWSEPIFLIIAGIRDLGLPVHTLRVTPRPFGNLLAVEVGWGGILTVLTFVGAPYLALFNASHHPDLVGVLQALSLYILLEGLARVARTYFEGEFLLRETVFPEIARNLTYSGTALALAVAGHGVWSVVIAYVVSAAVFAALLWLRAWGRIPLAYQRGQTLRLVRDGLPIGAIWLLVLCTTYVDTLILGTRFPYHVIGAYGFSYWIGFLVSLIMLEPVGRVLYATMVTLADEPRRLFEMFRVATLFLFVLVAPAACFIFVNAEIVLRILGGTQWDGAARFLRVLCLAPLMDPFRIFGGDVLMVRRQERIWITSAGVTLLWFIGAGLAAIRVVGPIGMACVNLLPVGGIVMMVALRRLAPGAFRDLVRDLGFIYAVPLALFAVVWFVPGVEPLGRFALSFVALAATAVIFQHRLHAQYVQFFRQHDGD